MNRVILIALAVASMLLVSESATAYTLPARMAVDPVVFEGEPEYPSVANPNGVGAAVEVDLGARAQMRRTATSAETSASRGASTVARWWTVVWRWAWALL